MSKTVTCKKCGLYYKSIKNLRQHVLKHHPLLIDKIAPKKRILNQGTNNCNECPKSFVRACDLRRHQRIKHSNVLKHLRSLKSKIRCSICEFNCTSQKLLMEHLQQSHDIKLSIESKTFNNIEDLNEWRLLIENETNSKYIRACGPRTNLDGSKSIYYRCQRSGYYISKGKGLRPLKSLGSRKLNGSCPASIRISISSDGRCKVCFVKTHVGHLSNMSCLSLSEQQLKLFASRIKTNIPLHAILDEVRDSLTESKLERLHLVSKEDMFRIRNSFNLTINSTDEVVQDDGTNVDFWIQETIDTGASCVLFYKPKGAIFENYPELNTNDFLLIVMNGEQCEVLKRYGNDCICIDRTINLSANGLELVTVLVLDNVRQAFPCAFFITNRTDIISLTVFFQIIRQTTDTLSPKIFMSDREEAFYHAWLDVMNPPAIQLYCMWLIDAVWRSNLSKIGAMIKQIEVYKILRTLMNHENQETFEESLNTAIKILCDNSETSEFGFYFLTEHAPYYALWAKCYRVTSGIESNIQMERVHSTLKYVFLNGKRVKRLDKTIHSLMVLVRDKLVKNLINTSHCEDIASKHININIQHEISLQLSEDLVMEEDKAWKVLGGSELQKSNLVQELYPECQCLFQCHTCKVCIHRYVCTCMDSATRWNMCRHIHLVCRKRNVENLSQLCDNPALIGNENHIMDVEELSVDPAEMEDVTSMDISLESRRTQLKEKWFSIIDSISTSEELDILENCLTSMEKPLAVARSQNEACGEMVLNNSPNSSTFLLLPENKDPTQQALLFQSYNEARDVHDKNTTFQLVLLKAPKNTSTKFCN